MDAAGKRADRFHGGIDIGGLGVVIELDPSDASDKLEPMFDSAKSADSFTNDVVGNSGQLGGAYRGQNIFDVVLAFERNFAQR